MSTKQTKRGKMYVLLDEIGRSIKEASPKQVRAALERSGLTERAEENRKRLRRALSIDYGADMTSPLVNRKAALTKFGQEEDIGACRVRLRFALASDPTIEKALGVSLADVSNLTDDVVIEYYHKLRKLIP